MSAEDWIAIVPFMPRAEADQCFNEWLMKHGLTREDVPPDDLLIDTGRGPAGKDYRRFRVRATVLARLNTLVQPRSLAN